jgi:hypothetical protein
VRGALEEIAEAAGGRPASRPNKEDARGARSGRLAGN